MGAPWMEGGYGGGGGGKGKRPASWCSQDSYFESSLRPEDVEGYTSAGLLLYRTGANGLEVLVACESPWNPLANDYDPLAWNPLCGKKTSWSGEWEAQVTAARCLMEVFGGCEEAPTREKIEQLCRSAPVLWYPAGRFALYIREFTSEDGEVFDQATKFFATAKENGLYPHSPEEKRMNSKGQPTTRWVKKIEELEWVPASDLLADESRKPLADLLRNICLNGTFRSFLQEGTMSVTAPIAPADGAGEGDNRRKGGKDKGGGGKWGGKDGGARKGAGGGKGKGKGDKGKGMAKGKGMPYASFAPMPPPQVNPQMYPIEVQRQMLGEKLYMTVQPMVSTPMVAQKVTGMLLELPMPELTPLLGAGPEDRKMLEQRVSEAMEVLEAEDFAAAQVR